MSYLTPFLSYRGVLVKLSLLTGRVYLTPSFEALKGELLNTDCKIWHHCL